MEKVVCTPKEPILKGFSLAFEFAITSTQMQNIKHKSELIFKGLSNSLYLLLEKFTNQYHKDSTTIKRVASL